MLNRLSAAIAALLVASTLPAHANGTARFDTFTEGLLGQTVTDGGVTFSNLDVGFGTAPNDFVCENGATDFAAFAGFTPPNALGFSGWVPGPQSAYTSVVSFELTTGQVEDHVSMDFYVAGGVGTNAIVFEGWMGTTLVGSTSFTLPTTIFFQKVSASWSGVAFDRLVVRGNPAVGGGHFYASVDNVVLTGPVPPPPPGVRFCAGDGADPAVTVDCPCGNFGLAGNGCANSVNANGAALDLGGHVATDDVTLLGTGMPATASCIYLQGTQLELETFGDGVRCLGGTLLRMRTKSNVAGASQFPDSTDTVTLSQRGGVAVGSGATRYYQTYYRNSAAQFCPPETFNVTNGAVVVW
ncbi:MAG: hypothetical protein IPJ77_12260 [Planctomycetes bacterium]|nr:hypothetical protein [Planctomycetota bacterium]